jgi:glycogen debranching enzyme
MKAKRRASGASKPASKQKRRDTDPYYIAAPTAMAHEQHRVLKHGDTFAVLDSTGDISPMGLGEEGLYHAGTRFLSRLQLYLADERPLQLSSFVKDDNVALVVALTNPDILQEGQLRVPRGTIHLARSKFLWDGCCYERIRVQNYGRSAVETTVTLEFNADYADIFEVRGTRRSKRGKRLPTERTDVGVVLAYEGLDGVVRQTCFEFSPAPSKVSEHAVRFDIALQPQSQATIQMTVHCAVGSNRKPPWSYASAWEVATEALRQARADHCHVHTNNEQFNDWINRSLADLHMMATDTPQGPYPYAGVPWFSTAFGRDGIITALQTLWIAPSLARGVLGFLAANQARESNAEQDAEPGKILHETRQGEMAALGEIPFGRYYGSVDSTPLFVLLAGAYFERTGDRPFLDTLWEAIERALHWIDRFGDTDGDGFVEYIRHSGDGLVQQGWKDSHDSVFHADGSPAPPPIALCEVQAYVYDARRRAAQVAGLLGHHELAARQLAAADRLQARFEEQFWCEDLSMYALALDGEKRPCRVRSSNAGQCLMSGIASPDRARRVGEALLGEGLFSGWGIRTLHEAEARYNPMSYHNGSVWPHDNALVAFGLSRYRMTPLALPVLDGLFSAGVFVDLHRMPELFCGFRRRPGEGPTLYPVACAPQSWAAGAVFMLLQACLGLTIDAPARRIIFSYPLLPPALPWVKITGLAVGEASVDLLLERHELDVGISVLRRDGLVEIRITK